MKLAHVVQRFVLIYTTERLRELKIRLAVSCSAVDLKSLQHLSLTFRHQTQLQIHVSELHPIFGGLFIPVCDLQEKIFGFAVPLAFNKQTGQWGTEYKKEMDLGRVAMTAKTLSETRDAFVIALEPAAANATGGTLRMSWGKSEFSAPFTIAQ